MNALYKLFFQMTGLDKAVPFNGIRTYIIIVFAALADTVPIIMAQIEAGQGLSDMDFVLRIAATVITALVTAGFKKASVENAKALT